MAQELADGEFWLPPEFLNDEDILMAFTPGKPRAGEVFDRASAGFYSPQGLYSGGPNSDLSSPVESVMGSTETESDEDDYLNGLTRKLGQTSLQDDFWPSENHSKSTRGTMAGSPQSTLCGCKQGPSRGSPTCPSPPVNRNEPSWDLLYAAAGEVARMRMAEEAAAAAARYYTTPRNHPNPSQNLHYQRLQALQFHQLKQQQMKKQHQYQQMIQQERARNGLNSRPSPLPLSAWPTLQQSQQQQSNGSGMRAVFLGNPNPKRESTGTGVFLPRQMGTPTEPRKKRGCSTVLLPDRVVHALNLNLEAMEAQSQSKLQSRYNGGNTIQDSEAELMYRNSVLRRNSHRQPPAMTELRLPQEWTY